MVVFCNQVIEEIKSAGTETELKEVINNSLSRLRALNNAYREAGYIVRIIVMLRVAQTEKLMDTELSNIRIAIKTFKQYQPQGS